MTVAQRLYAVRGAVCCTNTVDSILARVPQLYKQLLEKNHITEDLIVSVCFTVTNDLTALNPATALRKAGMAQAVPLFAAAEPYIVGYLPSVIRVLITFYGDTVPKPVYLHGAELLRPDLEQENPSENTL